MDTMNDITQMQLNAISDWSRQVEAQLLSTTETIKLLFEVTQELNTVNKVLLARIEVLEGRENESA